MAVSGYNLQISRSEQMPYRVYGAYRVVYVIASVFGEFDDTGLFLFHQPPQSPYGESINGQFVGVASPSDLAKYPLDAAVAEIGPYFRSASLTLDFNSRATADMTTADIEEELRQLASAVDRMDPSSTQDIWYPSQPDVGDSESN